MAQPDISTLICLGYDDDVPVFVPRDSPEGIAAAEFQRKRKEDAERAELARLKSKFEA